MGTRGPHRLGVGTDDSGGCDRIGGDLPAHHILSRQMIWCDQGVAFMVSASLSAAACTSGIPSKNRGPPTDFASRYAAAWSSQNPDKLTAFYSEGGSPPKAADSLGSRGRNESSGSNSISVDIASLLA